MEINFLVNEHPNVRLIILAREIVLVSPQLSKRAWQGKVEDTLPDVSILLDPKCYLYPTINALIAA